MAPFQDQNKLELSQKCRIPPHSALSQNKCHVTGKKISSKCLNWVKFEITGFYTLEVTACVDPHLKTRGSNSKYTEDRVMLLMYCCTLLLNVCY